MPWSFALPQVMFTSPLLAVATPIVTGSAVGLLTNRECLSPAAIGEDMISLTMMAPGTGQQTKDTYHQLRQPPFNPPGWLFGPVWTVLYGMMGYAAHHATMTATRSFSLAVRDANDTAQTLYTTQLALNFLWMPLFFGLGRPASALGDITLLIGNVTLLLVNYWKIDRTAFWLIVPYYAWLGFATYLNAGVGHLNGWTLPGQKKRSEE